MIIIGIYERFLAQGQRFRASSSGAAHGIYSTFSRGVKHVPFLESLVGASTTDLYDAIFDVDASQTYELFESDEEDEVVDELISLGAIERTTSVKQMTKQNGLELD